MTVPSDRARNRWHLSNIGTLLWKAACLALAAVFLTTGAAAQAPSRQQQKREQPKREQLQPQYRIDYEAVMYAQPRLIDEMMANVLPSDKDRPSTYFVGFASFAEQDVFLREVAQARDIVDERFGTHQRSILLVNHPTALEEVPLASVTNLDTILSRLGRIMNREKDTLILFLTSHGIPNLFAVEFPGFPLNHLTPARLARSLERSGIENRIVIISACHSGSFIPALSTPKTVVLTAARTDRTSFGCDQRNDWTYFGNALFNHALRTTTSFPEAFSRARALIAEWESSEKLPPSEPQIFQGSAAAPMLERLAHPATLPSATPSPQPNAPTPDTR